MRQKISSEEKIARRTLKRETLAELKNAITEEYSDFCFSEMVSELNELMNSIDRDEVEMRIKILRQKIKDEQIDDCYDYDRDNQ